MWLLPRHYPFLNLNRMALRLQIGVIAVNFHEQLMVSNQALSFLEQSGHLRADYVNLLRRIIWGHF